MVDRLEIMSTMGEPVLPDWNMECFYCQTRNWEQLGLEGYQFQYRFSSLREKDIQNDPASWKTTNKLMRLKTKTLHQIIDLIFKLAGEHSLLHPASPQGTDQTVRPRPRGPRPEPYGSPSYPNR
jgi:hypothetical protein